MLKVSALVSIAFITMPQLFLALPAEAQQASDHKAISSDKAPAAIGPYSAGIAVGNMVFLSGQIPLIPGTTDLVKGRIEDQTKQVLENLKALLQASGLTMANVVQTTVYMKDINDFAKMNTVYGTYFPQTPPARATVEVARLPRDAAIEIALIAAR